MAGTALLLVFNSTGYASADTLIVNGADTALIGADPNATPAVSFLTDHIATFADNVNITGTVITSDTGTGTLTFNGTSTVSNTVGTSVVLLKAINSEGAGEVLTFNENVQSEIFNLNGFNTVVFNKNLVGDLNLGAAGGSVIIEGNINGSVYSLSEGTGTLTISGSSDISGTVGIDTGSGGTSLAKINVGADGSVVDFNKAVAVDDIILTGTGNVNFNSTLDVGNNISFNDAATISFNNDVTLAGGTGIIDFSGKDGTLILNTGVSKFDTDVDNKSGLADLGTLTVLGNTTLSGDIGKTNSLKLVRAAEDGVSAKFEGSVNTATIEVMGNGTVTFDNNINADNIIYTDSGTLKLTSTSSIVLSGGVDFEGKNGVLSIGNDVNVAYSVDNTGIIAAGTFTLEGGNQTVSGVIGTTKALAVVNAGAAASITTFTNTVNVSNLNVSGTGTVNLDQGLTGNLVFAGDGIVNLDSGKTISGNVLANTAGNGELVLEGGTQSFAGTIGASANIGSITSSAAAANLDFLNTVGANTITISGNTDTVDFSKALNVGALNISGVGTITNFDGVVTATTMDFTGITETINFNNNLNVGTLNITGGSAIVGFDNAVVATTVNIASAGSTVNFDSTVSATTLGVTGSNSLVTFDDAVTAATLNVAEDGSNVTFSDTVSSTNINLLGTGSVAFNDNVTGSINFTGGNSNVTIANGMVLTGGMTTSTNGTGNVTFLGAMNVSGAIGKATNYLRDLNAGVDGKAVVLGGAVYSDTIDLAGSGTVSFGSTTSAGVINVSGLGTITHTGDVDATTINFTGAKVVNYGGDLNATDLNFSAAAILTVNGDADIDAINMNTDGRITFNGDVTNAVIQGGGVVGAGVGSVIFADSATNVQSIGVGAGNVLKVLSLSGNADTITVTGGDVIAADTTTLVNNTLNITNGSFTIGNGVDQTLKVNLYETSASGGKIVASVAPVVGANTNLVISVDASEYVADGTRYTIVDGVTGGGLVSSIKSVSGINSNMIKYLQDTTNHDDLIIVATRTTLDTFATTHNAKIVGQALDDIAMTGNADLDTLQLSLQAEGNAGNTENVNNILQSLVSAADGGAILSSINVGAITQGVNEGRMAALRIGYDDYSNGYYSGDTANSMGSSSAPVLTPPPEVNIDNSTLNDGYDEDYDSSQYYYDSGISSGSMTNGYSLWTQAYARDGNQDPTTGYNGYDSLTFGVIVGIDTTELFEDTVFGVSFGFGQTDIKSRNLNRTKTDLTNYSVSLYSNYDFNDNFFMDTQASFGYNAVNSRRYNVGGSGNTASAEYNSNQYLARALLGYDAWLANGLILTPTISSSYSYLYNEAYSEKDAGGLGLQVKSAHIAALNFGGGLLISSKMESLDHETVLKPSLHLGYEYNVAGDRLKNVSSFIGGGSEFVTDDTKNSRNKANAGVGIDYTNYIWTTSLNYDYEYQTNYQGHSASAKLSIEF